MANHKCAASSIKKENAFPKPTEIAEKTQGALFLVRQISRHSKSGALFIYSATNPCYNSVCKHLRNLKLDSKKPVFSTKKKRAQPTVARFNFIQKPKRALIFGCISRRLAPFLHSTKKWRFMMENKAYFDELSRVLKKHNIESGPVENGRLVILLDGQSVGRIEKGAIRCVAPGDLQTAEASEAFSDMLPIEC